MMNERGAKPRLLTKIVMKPWKWESYRKRLLILEISVIVANKLES
jgi:hypothetical protein